MERADLCSVGIGPQDEWYFFRHANSEAHPTKKNYWRTALGRWKAWGREKPVFVGSGTKIGLRKTMVYYKRGKRTDWILHQLHLPAVSTRPLVGSPALARIHCYNGASL